jgi:hypothetical protein
VGDAASLVAIELIVKGSEHVKTKTDHAESEKRTKPVSKSTPAESKSKSSEESLSS